MYIIQKGKGYLIGRTKADMAYNWFSKIENAGWFTLDEVNYYKNHIDKDVKVFKITCEGIREVKNKKGESNFIVKYIAKEI